jgi:hypothetical protein
LRSWASGRLLLRPDHWRLTLTGRRPAAILDESTGRWTNFELDLDDHEALEHFLKGEIRARRH